MLNRLASIKVTARPKPQPQVAAKLPGIAADYPPTYPDSRVSPGNPRDFRPAQPGRGSYYGSTSYPVQNQSFNPTMAFGPVLKKSGNISYVQAATKCTEEEAQEALSNCGNDIEEASIWIVTCLLF